MLYKNIKKQILDDVYKLKPNQRIPSRVELVSRFGVTRTTIERAISELVGEGYLYTKGGSGTFVSDLQAIRQRNSQSSQWGVILPNILHDTYPGILRGIEDVASINNINIHVGNTDNNPDKQKQYIKNMINNSVDGLIIVPSIIEDRDISVFNEVKDNEIPIVACNRSISGFECPKVLSNNYHGGYLATRHLLQQGYKKIGFVAGISYSLSIERYKGYLTALSEMGVTINEDHVHFEEYSSTAVQFDKVNKIGYKVVKDMLLNQDKPEAFFCFDDLIAQGAYYAINDSNLAVGSDIGLVGYNYNRYICESLPGELTSIDFKAYEIGKAAANILLDASSKVGISNSKTFVIQPELQIGGSSKGKTSNKHSALKN